jgi:two-component system, OmpR family, response regulator VicR
MKKKILVVDDEEDIANLVKLILEPVGFEVEEVCDPKLAFETAKRFRPDAVLLDLLMPGLDGWEIFAQLRNDPDFSSIPIAILTAKSKGVDQMVGLHVMKANSYITKPFGIQELIDKTNELFRKKAE